MSRITLPAGVTVLVAPAPGALTENRLRSAMNGTRFVPPWDIWAHGPREDLAQFLGHPALRQAWDYNFDTSRLTLRIGAHWLELTDAQPAHTFTAPPYRWLPRDAAAHLGAWLWTESGAELETEQEGADARTSTPARKPRKSRAARKDTT